MADSRYIVDVFDDIVDSMRDTGIITDSVDVDGTYTLTTANTFEVRNAISINDINYLILGATETTITIEAATGLDFSGETWKNLSPYYEFGHPIEVSNTLALQSDDPLKKFNKYPLIYLLTDIDKDHDRSLILQYSAPISILIVNSTEPNYVSKERMAINVRPILHPLYESLLESMAKSRYLYENDKLMFSHKEIIRLYWGSTGIYGNKKLIFNDKLDAIEVNFNGIDVIRNINSCQ